VHVARLYQLTSNEFMHVLNTFPLVAKEIKEAAYDTYVRGFRFCMS